MANVLIAGCGDIGCQLGSLLAKQNHTIYGIRRNVEDIPDSISPIQADLALKLPDLPDNIDYVFYIASAGKYKDSAYYQAYVLGVQHTLEAIKDKNIKRVFFISSSSVFGQSDGEKVDETCPTSDANFSTKRLLEGEALILESKFPSTIVRFGGIYGPGRTHLIDLVQAGKAHCMEDVWSNRIHSADCAGMLAHLMNYDIENPEKVESLYVGVDNQPTPSCEVYDWLAEQLCVPDVEHIEPKESSRQMRSNKRLSNARIKATGYNFIYPTYQDGYLALLDTLD